MFTSEFFAGNRARLRQLLDNDAPVVLTANGLMQRTADTVYKFRQDSNFWYLTGVTDPDVVLVMDGADEYFIVPKRDPVMEIFEGSVDAGAVAELSGIKTFLDDEEGWKKLEKRLKQVRQVATLSAPPAYIDFHQFYTNPARAALNRKLKAANRKIEVVDLREIFSKMRVVKQPAELEAIRRAVEVTVNGMKYVTDPARLAKYEYENEVDADLTRQFRRDGCGHAFDPIVAGGRRGVQMHSIDNDGKLEHGELIIIDIGAENSLYAADVARTVIVGEPTKRQRAIYDAVCEAQDHAYSLIKPGVIHLEYEHENERFIGEKLRELGIIKDTNRESIRKHYPHMMSHFVGLEAHDVGDYRQAMQAGSVMVVEPGMYSYDEGLGVRIEDVVVITEDGYELLSRGLKRSL